MLVAPLYARHKSRDYSAEEDEWSIPWILRFCKLIVAMKYICPISLAVIGFIDFFVTWKYCGIFPLWSASVFGTGISGCFLVFVAYAALYFLLVVCDVPLMLFTTSDPNIKCLLFLMMFSVIFCVSPFMLYAVFAFIFSFQSWTQESSEYNRIKWIFHHIVQYLQNDINTISSDEFSLFFFFALNVCILYVVFAHYVASHIPISGLKYFRIARDRPLRIYIIMFKALIMWLNIQLFQFLMADYPRYSDEWRAMRSKMEKLEIQREHRRQYAQRVASVRRPMNQMNQMNQQTQSRHVGNVWNPTVADSGSTGVAAAGTTSTTQLALDMHTQNQINVRGLDDTEEEDDPSLSSNMDNIENMETGCCDCNGSKSSKESSDSRSNVLPMGCCDFNFKLHGRDSVEYDSMRSNRYDVWANERYFKSLRPPLAILHEIVGSYPQSAALNPMSVNVYNLSQRHLYRYSNETFQKAAADKNPLYALCAIALYGWTIVHTVLFWVCYHWGFKKESQAILSFVYIAEYVALYSIYTILIFNVLHCDRLLTVIYHTSWFDDRLSDIIKSSLLGKRWKSEWANHQDTEQGINEAVMVRLKAFHVHHQRIVGITVQHYMMVQHVVSMSDGVCIQIIGYFRSFCIRCIIWSEL